MEYKVVPFMANIKPGDITTTVAKQLQEAIDHHSSGGWEFKQVDTVQTYIQPSGGCFGFGKTPAQLVNYNMLVFERAVQ